MIILTLNCGSSSLKYQIYDWDNKNILAGGLVERVGQPDSVIKHQCSGREEYVHKQSCPTHKEALTLLIDTVLDEQVGVIKEITEIKAVGHRVVHGGEKFSQSVIVTPAVLEAFRAVQDLSPLHNPANIMGIEAAQKLLPHVPHCAIMDTAWHQTMPQRAFLYALPHEWYQKYGVRRYGFHGTSFLYTAKRASVLLDKDPFQTNLIIAHIGNGSSINAVSHGVSVDTSMGLTPLEGLIMGTRSGDHDPAIPFYIMKKTGMSAEEAEKVLNKKSGVLGITEEWVDRRDIELAAEKGHPKAQLAIDMEAYRLRKYFGAYYSVLGRVDAIVFTAGVGERGPIVREKSLEGLETLGIKIDREKNWISMTRNGETMISADDSAVKIFVIPTNEELVMTEDTYALLQGSYDVHTNFRYSFQDKDYVNSSRMEGLSKELVKRPALNKILVKPLGEPVGALA